VAKLKTLVRYPLGHFTTGHGIGAPVPGSPMPPRVPSHLLGKPML